MAKQIPTLHVSFERQNLRIGMARWLFPRGHTMRFEWLALLAYRRKTRLPDESWADARAIARLPHWRGKTPPHIGTNIGRYLQDLVRRGSRIVDVQNAWSGPYRLEVPAAAVSFDIPLEEVRRRLHIPESFPPGAPERYREFTWHYAKAQALVYQGQLSVQGHERTTSAYREFLRLAEDVRFVPNLRLLAIVAALGVQYRLGLFQTASQTLGRFRGLLERATDASLKARYILAVSRGEHRRANGATINMRTEAGINAATAYAAEAGDRAALGEIGDRTGWLHAKNGRNEDAINSLLQVLECHLVTGNFDRVHACCCNIGSILHRMDEPYYREAREWLLLSVRISHWMHLGRDGAHAEIVLAKMDIEGRRSKRARRWIERALHVAEEAGNQVDVADAKLIDALWHQSFGTPGAEKRALADAVRGYRALQNFNLGQKETYIKHKFPTIWEEVLGTVAADRNGPRVRRAKRPQARKGRATKE